MHAQLGVTQFDGAKSFVSFSSDEEAIIVEHALINRPAKLQATARGLRTLTLSLFLHQEFCKVTEEVSRLRNSKNKFEILPLIWGNGQTEGDFVIKSLNESKVQMDAIGNTVAATVQVTLIENFDDDKQNQKQVDAQKNAFAVGDKTPPTKSNRVNPVSCNQRISALISGIKANGGVADRYCQGYTNVARTNALLKFVLKRIDEDCQKIVTESASPSSCANKVPGLGAAGNDVKARTAVLLADINQNETLYPHLIYAPNIVFLKGHNNELQGAIRKLDNTANSLTKESITKK